MPFERTIEIAAPPAMVWGVTIDFDRWPEWTPSTISARREDAGPLQPGSRAILELRGRPGPAPWIVTYVEEGRMFRWQTKSGPGVIAEAEHEVTPSGDGTRARLLLRLRGPLGWLLDPLVGRMVRENIEAEAAGLKRRCEELARGSGG